MAIQGKKLSELTEQVSNIQGKERIYVSDGSGKPKFIETNQLAKPSDIPDVSGFITKPQADGYYQPKGSYATTTQLADKALESGELKLMEGKLTFNKEDLTELKNLLNYNLPVGQTTDYVVKTSDTKKAEAQAAESPAPNTK